MKKLQKILKGALSVFLCMVMLLTTFFIFDPSIILPETNAVVDTDELSSSAEPSVKFYVPEAIYLNPVINNDGTYSFQYFIDSDDSGTLNQSASQTTGMVYFFCSVACSSIKIDWENSNVTTQNLKESTQLLKQTVTGGTTTVRDGAVKVTCTYVAQGRTYTATAYTYMYYPDLDLLTGTAAIYDYNARIGDEPILASFSFITGVHFVGNNTSLNNDKQRSVSNYYDQYTLSSSKGAFGLSPLIPNWSTLAAFKGDNGDQEGRIADADTVYNEMSSSSPFIESGNGGVFYRSRIREREDSYTIGSADYNWGTLYVDTSRVSNYNQIPNLKGGFICHSYWHCGKEHELESFGADDNSISIMNYVNYKNGDGKGYGMTDSDRLSGTPQEKTYTMRARYKMRVDSVNTAKVRLNILFGLRVHIVNKGSLRTAYRAAIENGWQEDTASKNGWTASVQSSWTAAYSAYKTALQEAGTVLGRPYADATAVSNALNKLNSAVKALSDIVEANFNAGENAGVLPQVYFYVPETIYLNAADNKSFQYFYGVDENGASDGKNKTLADAEKGAKVYFNGKNCKPSSVKITVEAAAADNTTSWTNTNSSALSTITYGGETFTGATASSTGKSYTEFPVNTSCTAGAFSAALGSNAYRFLKWTASYVVDGIAYETYAYSICYAPNTSLAGAASRTRHRFGTSSSDKKVSTDIQQITWIAGVTGSEANGNRYVNSANFNPMLNITNPPSGRPGISQDTEGNYHYSKNDTSINTITFVNGEYDDDNESDYSTQAVSPLGSLVLDSTRFDNLLYIPNFRIGHMLSHSDEGSASVKERTFAYYFSDVSASMKQNGAGNYYITGVNDNEITTGNTETSNQSKAFYQNGTHSGPYIGNHYDVTYENLVSKNTCSVGLCAPRFVANETWDKVITSTQVIAVAGATRYGVRKEDLGWLSYRATISNSRTVAAVKVTVVDKSIARKNYQDAVSAAKQQSWYEDDADKGYDLYQNSILEMAVNLGNPGRSKTNSQVDVSKLHTKGGTTTAVHLRDGESADYNGNVGKAVIGTTTESMGYTYGDKVYGYYNNIPGFTASRYSVKYGSTTKTEGLPQDEDYNKYYYIKNASTPTIEWTFWYKPNEYKVTYNPNGGTYKGTAENTVSSALYQSKYIVGEGETQIPTRDGCTFLGWKCDYNNEHFQLGDEINWTFLKDITFTAEWQYNTYYTLFNENHDGIAPNVFTSGIELNKSKTDHSTDTMGNEYEMVIKRVGNGTLCVDGKLADNYVMEAYPINEYGEDDSFRFLAGEAYTFSLEVLSGTMSTLSGKLEVELLDSAGNTIVTVLSCSGNAESPINSMPADTAAKIAAFKISLKHDSKMSNYTEFNNFTFKLRIERSSKKTQSDIFASRNQYGSTYTWLPEPVRTGYTFMGWYTEPTGGEQVKVDDTVFPHDVTLYAHWDPNPYAVEFIGNGETSGTMENQSFRFDEEKALNDNKFMRQRFVTYFDGETEIEIESTAYTVASAPFLGWAETETGTVKYRNGARVINLTSAKNTVFKLYAVWGDFPSVTTPEYTKDGYVLLGWSKSADTETVDYIVGQATDPITENTKLYAVWHEEKVEEDIVEKDEGIESIKVLLGYNADGTEKFEMVSRWTETTLKAYKAARDEFKKAKSDYDKAEKKNTIIATALSVKERLLQIAISKLVEKTVDTRFVDAFFVKGDSENRHSVKEINLNKYATETLNIILSNYTLATDKKWENAPIFENQNTLNSCVKALAEAFVNVAQAKTSVPTYTLYDSAESIKEQLEKSGLGVNYVMKSGGSTTYYCYTNKANPTVYLTVDVAATNGRACYPTRSTLTQENVENILGKTSAVTTGGTLETRDVTSTYSEYLNAGLGTTYSEDINGTAYTGTDYYNKQSLIKLAPEFTEGKDGAVKYTIVSEDDSLTPNKATKTKSSAALDNTLKAISDDNGSTLTIVIDYHTGAADADGKMVPIYAWGAQTSEDVWLKQYHIFRSAQGARNWELPQANAKTDGKTQYIVNDDTYGQSDRGSFTFTFELASTNDIANGKLNTTNVDEIIGILQNSGSYNAAVEKTFIGTNKDGDGLGYQKWGTNWSFNYYPKSGAYTYVHLVDRWGNTCDDVFCVGNQDSFPIQSAKVNTLTEKGGSGISTLSLDAEIELIADENSVIDGEVYKTTGNTVRFKTPAANKSYTLTMTDKATNQSTATLTSDENGIVSLNVEDEAYSGGVYTFTLNGKEINLYAELEKRHVISVENGTAYTGSSATAKIITDGSVSKVRLIDKNGNTITNNSCVRNADGTKTWQFTRKMSEGEYSYSISTKVGEKWGSETATVSFKFTKKAPATGKLMSAEYEDGLYKLTLEGKGTKVQFTDRIGLTRTYSRSNSNVKKVVENGDGTEVWYVKTKLIKGAKYTVAAKFNAGWNRTDTVTITAE